MINQQYQSHRTDLEYFFGCGYNLKFLKKMYFTQSIGIGFIHEYTKIQYENLPKYNVDESFNRASILLSAGLGYKF
jgi:hypothetical protein